MDLIIGIFIKPSREDWDIDLIIGIFIKPRRLAVLWRNSVGFPQDSVGPAIEIPRLPPPSPVPPVFDPRGFPLLSQ